MDAPNGISEKQDSPSAGTPHPHCRLLLPPLPPPPPPPPPPSSPLSSRPPFRFSNPPRPPHCAPPPRPRRPPQQRRRRRRRRVIRGQGAGGLDRWTRRTGSRKSKTRLQPGRPLPPAPCPLPPP